MKSNTEIAICEICKERFQKRKVGQRNAGGMRIRSIRPAHAKTCSRECSRKYVSYLNAKRKENE